MIKHTIQLAKNECGIACLKMFYDLYDVDVTYEDLFSKIDLKEEGISMEEMLYFLKPLGNFKAFEIEKEELRNMTPSIILLSYKKRSHYVVVWKYSNGYFYISDPNLEKITKIKEKKLLKHFSKYVIFNTKRNLYFELEKEDKIKFGNFKIPYIILSIFEMLLLTYSIMYLFSITDYTAFKIYYFLFILFINCIISIIKNYCFNKIIKNLDDNYIDKNIKENFISGKINDIDKLKIKIQKGYELKGEYIKYLSLYLPNLLIIIGSLIYFLFIDFYLFLGIFDILLIIFLINFSFSKKKNYRLYLAKQEERKLDLFNKKELTNNDKNEVLNELELIKNESSLFMIYSQHNSLVLFAIKQFGLMLILIYMYISKIELYSIFVITFYFYCFDGVIEISEFNSKIKERKLLKRYFLHE